jgi:lipoprotein-anchoring transpeptidase ErfK/SrfK
MFQKKHTSSRTLQLAIACSFGFAACLSSLSYVAIAAERLPPTSVEDLLDRSAEPTSNDSVGELTSSKNERNPVVDFPTAEPAGSIVVDTVNASLFFVLGDGHAIQYRIAVGRRGSTWSGVKTVLRKEEWPDWYPTAEMRARQPDLPRFVAGGPGNPLGARALYLGNTPYRIHGTNQRSSIGKHASSGCIRMLNEDVVDLYSRVEIGAKVVVLSEIPYRDQAPMSGDLSSTWNLSAIAPVGLAK